LRTTSPCGRVRRPLVLLSAVIACVPCSVSAEGLFDFLFGGPTRPEARQPAPANSFDPFGSSPPAAQPARPTNSGPAFCVRRCDGKYFPLTRGNASPAEICQAFCPASPTKVYFGANIDGATAAGGERYADSANAFAYRKALRVDCTCNGRNPAGLAPIDLALDSSLRPGDVVATTEGLVAYSGARAGDGPGAEFTPVAAYPGLTAEVRARLSGMKVAPIRAEVISGGVPAAAPPPLPVTKDKRAAAD
jgi:hypothetical protein